MAGNDKRRGAVRKPGTKKGMVVGSGGQRRKALEGKGPTPKAENRYNHPAKRKADARKQAQQQQEKRRKEAERAGELVAGRNPVVECVRAGVPTSGLYVAFGIDTDDRVTEAVRLAADQGVSVLEVPRGELDKMTGGAVHQGMALQIPPYHYSELDDLLVAARNSGMPPLLVALDGVTDPRNLGAVIRSAAAFGAHGVVLPQRRSAGMTAVAWRTSAGAAARLPVAKVTNLNRSLKSLKQEGLTVVGLDADAEISSDELDSAEDPLCLVVGSEGRGLSRLTREYCDRTISIPMAGGMDSLNASVAASVLLADVARRRRLR